VNIALPLALLITTSVVSVMGGSPLEFHGYQRDALFYVAREPWKGVPPSRIGDSRVRCMVVLGTDLTLSETDIAQIAKFENLEYLALAVNRIESLEPSFARLRNLRRLTTISIVGNPLTNITTRIGELDQVEVLMLSKCRLASVPDGIGDMANLRILELSLNGLSNVPPCIVRLKKLTELGLAGNPIQIVDERIFPPSLREINLKSAPLAEVKMLTPGRTLWVTGSDERAEIRAREEAGVKGSHP
jgi:hypothetical protein